MWFKIQCCFPVIWILIFKFCNAITEQKALGICGSKGLQLVLNDLEERINLKLWNPILDFPFFLENAYLLIS